MTDGHIDVPQWPAPWLTEVTAMSRHRVTMRVQRHFDITAIVDFERCIHGRLRGAYPAARRDTEVRVRDVEPPEALSAVLSAAAAAIQRADPVCRKVVYAVDRGTGDATRDAQAAAVAGFRYVVDVEIGGRDLGLTVQEPDWVTGADLDRDDVPGT